MMEIFEQKKVNYQLEIEGAAAISQSEIGLIQKVGKKIQGAIQKSLLKELNN